MSIPKIIHYCWFGRGSKPELALKCIDSWKRHCPDYEIIEWNEDNYDISLAPLYVRQAYASQKWAFATDYIRLDVVHKHGGIYLDTDVELLSSLDKFLIHNSFFAFEDEQLISTGLGFGSQKGEPILEEIASDYSRIPFILSDGSLDTLPCTERNTKVFLNHGLKLTGEYQNLNGGIAVYPPDFFNPKSYQTGKITITDKTVSVHHFDASWKSPEQKKAMEAYRKITKKYGLIAGERILLAKRLLRDEGVASLFSRIFHHFTRK